MLEAWWQGQECPFFSGDRRDRMPIKGVLLFLIIQIAFYGGKGRNRQTTDRETRRQKEKGEGSCQLKHCSLPMPALLYDSHPLHPLFLSFAGFHSHSH